jgi:iron(III) transport system permease protein
MGLTEAIHACLDIWYRKFLYNRQLCAWCSEPLDCVATTFGYDVGMLWDVPIVRALMNTLFVGIGASLLSTTVATCLAAAICLVRIPTGRLLSALVSSMVLIPLYVQATAWSAGFGHQGWFRWNQVLAATNPWYAILACLWIQASWLIPISYLILRTGLERSFDDSVKAQWLDGGLFQVFRHLLFRRILPWMVASLLIGFVLTSSDMIVTNLFQVPTLTETLYQQVQFQRIKTPAFLVAISYSIVVGIVAALSASRFKGLIGGERSQVPLFTPAGIHKTTTIVASMVAWAAFLVFIGLPLASLVVKTGWRVSMGATEVTRTWSVVESLAAMRGLTSFSAEFSWSVIIATLATILSVILGGLCVRVCRSVWRAFLAFGLFGFALSLPGPIINALLQTVFGDAESWIGTLRDRTVMMPVLGLQFRSLPIVFGVLWISRKEFDSQYRQLMDLDGSSSFQHREAMVRPWLIAATISFFLCFANLESYLLVLPPAVTTIAMRMFELLHYGVQNKESVLALFLAIASSFVGFVLSYREPRL